MLPSNKQTNKNPQHTVHASSLNSSGHVYLRADFQVHTRAISDGDYKYEKGSNFKCKKESVLTLEL